jgi:two-component sensor histidine kinase
MLSRVRNESADSQPQAQGCARRAKAAGDALPDGDSYSRPVLSARERNSDERLGRAPLRSELSMNSSNRDEKRAGSAADGPVQMKVIEAAVPVEPTDTGGASHVRDASPARLSYALSVLGDFIVGVSVPHLVWGSVLAILFYAAAVCGRDALHHLAMPGSVSYLTFFPTLIASAFLCGFFPTIALLIAFTATGFSWIDPAGAASLSVRFMLAMIFAVAGTAMIIPTFYAVAAQKRLKQHEKQLAFINEELRHRLKNLLAITSAICRQSLKSGATKDEISRDIVGRIQAVARAQDFLAFASNTGSDFSALIAAVIDPLCPNPARLQASGPSVIIPADSVTAFALVLHELATNAVKYGAWRPDGDGKVLVGWILKDGEFYFLWREKGVRFSAPARQGFGSLVIRRSLSRARVEHLLHADGVECTISMNL